MNNHMYNMFDIICRLACIMGFVPENKLIRIPVAFFKIGPKHRSYNGTKILLLAYFFSWSYKC